MAMGTMVGKPGSWDTSPTDVNDKLMARRVWSYTVGGVPKDLVIYHGCWFLFASVIGGAEWRVSVCGMWSYLYCTGTYLLIPNMELDSSRER